MVQIKFTLWAVKFTGRLPSPSHTSHWPATSSRCVHHRATSSAKLPAKPRHRHGQHALHPGGAQADKAQLALGPLLASLRQLLSPLLLGLHAPGVRAARLGPSCVLPGYNRGAHTLGPGCCTGCPERVASPLQPSPHRPPHAPPGLQYSWASVSVWGGWLWVGSMSHCRTPMWLAALCTRRAQLDAQSDYTDSHRVIPPCTRFTFYFFQSWLVKALRL